MIIIFNKKIKILKNIFYTGLTKQYLRSHGGECCLREVNLVVLFWGTKIPLILLSHLSGLIICLHESSFKEGVSLHYLNISSEPMIVFTWIPTQNVTLFNVLKKIST